MLTLPLGGVKKYNEAFRVAVLEKRRENLKLNVVLVIETKALYYWKRGGGGETGIHLAIVSIFARMTGKKMSLWCVSTGFARG